MTTRNTEAVPVSDIRTARGTPGAFEIREVRDVKGMAFMCPCGCGLEGYIPLSRGRSESWEWDGNREKPTLSPSLQQVGGCKWHGYLRAGVFERLPT